MTVYMSRYKKAEKFIIKITLKNVKRVDTMTLKKLVHRTLRKYT